MGDIKVAWCCTNDKVKDCGNQREGKLEVASHLLGPPNDKLVMDHPNFQPLSYIRYAYDFAVFILTSK